MEGSGKNQNGDDYKTAYDNLEQWIRTLGKEKQAFEQKNEDLRRELTLAHERVQKMTISNQELKAQNKEMMKILAEVELTRASVENQLFAVEQKQEIIISTLHDLEKLAYDMNKRYDEHKEFIYCLKFRQLQLKALIDETAKKNRQLDLELTKQREKWHNLQLENTQAKAKHSDETKKFETQIGELSKTIQQLGVQLEEEKAAYATVLEEFYSATPKLERYPETNEKEKEALKLDIENLKGEAELQKKLFAEEKACLEKNLELAAKKQEGNKAAFEAEIDVLKKRIQGLTDALAVERTSIQSTIQGFQEKEAEMKSQLEAKERDNEILRESNRTTRKELEQFKKKAATEKSVLESKVGQLRKEKAASEESMNMLNEKLDDYYVEVERRNRAFSKEKRRMEKNFEKEINRLEEERMKNGAKYKKLEKMFHESRSDFKILYARYANANAAREASNSKTVPNATTTPRTGILKRINSGTGDKKKSGKQASFAPTIATKSKINSVKVKDDSDSKKKSSYKRTVLDEGESHSKNKKLRKQDLEQEKDRGGSVKNQPKNTPVRRYNTRGTSKNNM